MPTPDGQPTPHEQAASEHALALQGLDRLDSLLAQLLTTVGNLTDPEALAGVGNLDHYRQQAQAVAAELREGHAALRVWQEGNARFLAERGVPADLWPPRRRPDRVRERTGGEHT